MWVMQYKFLRFCRLPACGDWRGLMWFSGFGLHVGCFWFGWYCDFVLDACRNTDSWVCLGGFVWGLGAFVFGRVGVW